MAVGSGQWAVGSGQWAVGSRQLAGKSHRRDAETRRLKNKVGSLQQPRHRWRRKK